MPYINDVISKNTEMNQEKAIRNLQKQQKRMSRFVFDPEAVAASLNDNIVGQEAMQKTISDVLHIIKADFSPKNRPLSVCFFLGPTGVGKTQTVNVIAEGILGSADHVCRIDMNTLAQEHYVAALTGAPPGYVGSKENHTLFDIEKIQGSYSKPGIVLFDEIEKASKEVIRSLLNILDTGFLQLSGGTKTIDFRNSMIFMTSNVGAKALSKYQQTYRPWLAFTSSAKKEKLILEQALSQQFDPEFINRIDSIITFNAVESHALKGILDLQIDHMNTRLNKKNIQIVLDDKAKAYLLDAYDKRYGARDIARCINNTLNPQLARMINANVGSESLLVTVKDNRLIVEDAC